VQPARQERYERVAHTDAQTGEVNDINGLHVASKLQISNLKFQSAHLIFDI
jgi:hypothetical protein